MAFLFTPKKSLDSIKHQFKVGWFSRKVFLFLKKISRTTAPPKTCGTDASGRKSVLSTKLSRGEHLLKICRQELVEFLADSLLKKFGRQHWHTSRGKVDDQLITSITQFLRVGRPWIFFPKIFAEKKNFFSTKRPYLTEENANGEHVYLPVLETRDR